MATLNLRSGVRQRAWPRVVLVRWEETHSKQARFGGGTPGLRASPGGASRRENQSDASARAAPVLGQPGPAHFLPALGEGSPFLCRSVPPFQPQRQNSRRKWGGDPLWAPLQGPGKVLPARRKR